MDGARAFLLSNHRRSSTTRPLHPPPVNIKSVNVFDFHDGERMDRVNNRIGRQHKLRNIHFSDLCQKGQRGEESHLSDHKVNSVLMGSLVNGNHLDGTHVSGKLLVSNGEHTTGLKLYPQSRNERDVMDAMQYGEHALSRQFRNTVHTVNTNRFPAATQSRNSTNRVSLSNVKLPYEVPYEVPYKVPYVHRDQPKSTKVLSEMRGKIITKENIIRKLQHQLQQNIRQKNDEVQHVTKQLSDTLHANQQLKQDLDRAHCDVEAKRDELNSVRTELEQTRSDSHHQQCEMEEYRRNTRHELNEVQKESQRLQDELRAARTTVIQMQEELNGLRNILNESVRNEAKFRESTRECSQLQSQAVSQTISKTVTKNTSQNVSKTASKAVSVDPHPQSLDLLRSLKSTLSATNTVNTPNITNTVHPKSDNNHLQIELERVYREKRGLMEILENAQGGVQEMQIHLESARKERDQLRGELSRVNSNFQEMRSALSDYSQGGFH